MTTKKLNLYKTGTFISLAAILCFSVKLSYAEEELNVIRMETKQDFQDFKNGKQKSKPQESPEEAKSAELPAATRSPVAAPVAAKSGVGTIFRDCAECPEMLV